jgi:hypothetical protein
MPALTNEKGATLDESGAPEIIRTTELTVSQIQAAVNSNSRASGNSVVWRGA